MSTRSTVSGGAAPAPVRTASAPLELGVAVGPDAVTAVELRRTLRACRIEAVHTWRIGLPQGSDPWTLLEEALQELREAREARSGVLHLAFLRPLGWLKVLELPRLGPEDLRQMVERSAGRLFPIAPHQPVLAGVAPASRHLGLRGPRRTLAAIANAPLLAAAQTAAEAAGFRLGTACVGSAAAARGALLLAPGLSRGRSAVALSCVDGVELLCLERGRLRIARAVPLPAEADAGALLARMLEEVADAHGYRPDRVAVVAPEPRAGTLQEGAGVPCVRLDGPGASAEVMAALGAAAGGSSKPTLVTEAGRAVIRRRQRLRTAVLSALSAALLATAGHLHLQNLDEKAEAVRERRAQLRPAVQQALRARGEIAAVRTRVEALGALDASRTRWIQLFAQLTETLPRDAHLTSLRFTGTELHLQGRARSAAALVPVFEAAAWVRSVRLGSPVRRERTPRGVFERFSLTIELGEGAERAPGPSIRTGP